jgi:hypothetical protein
MRRTLALLIAAVLALAPAAAFALPSATAATGTAKGTTAGAWIAATPVEMGVQLGPAEKEGAEIIISARLATGAPLPATVRIPLPAGASLAWVGEIAGMGGTGDIQRTGSIEKGTGGQVVVVRLEKYREAQIEALYTVPQAAGDRLTSTLGWVQSAPAGRVVFVVRMAPGTSDITIDPAPAGPPQGDAATGRQYTLPPRVIPLGGTARLTVAYTRGGGSVPAAAGTAGSSGLLIAALLVALAVAVVAFVIVALRSRRASPSSSVPTPVRPESSRAPADPSVEEGGEKDPFDVDWT